MIIRFGHTLITAGLAPALTGRGWATIRITGTLIGK